MGRFLRLIGGLLLLAATLLAPALAGAMTSDEKEATFWRVAVVDFSGRTPVTDGATAAVRFAVGLRDSKRFHVIDPRSVRRAVHDEGIDVSSGTLTDADAKKLCKKLDVDGIFVGRIEKGPNGFGWLTISLHSETSGRLFAAYRFTITPEFPVAEAGRVAAGWISRLPYDGLVVSARSDLALVNLGTQNGISNGSRLWSFEFTSVTRDGLGIVTGGERKVLAELEVVRVEQHGAWVRPVKGDMPVEMTKISLRALPGSDALPQYQGQSTVGAVPYVDLDAAVDLGFLLKSYDLTGNGQHFSATTTLFPAPGVHVYYFPQRNYGAYLFFRHGFIPFRRSISSGVGTSTTFQTFQGSIDQAELQGIARHTFGGSNFLSGGAAWLAAGVFYSNFTIQSQNPLVLTSDSYVGPILSGDLRIPIVDRITGHLGAGVIPFALLHESPVNNGSGTPFGVTGTLGLDYHINDRLYVAADYGLNSWSTKFPSGGGSRGIQDPKSSDLYHGVTLSLGWRSYR